MSSPTQEQFAELARLQAAAEWLFRGSGIPASHPLIVQAISEYQSALDFNDYATLRFAIREFEYAVERDLRLSAVSRGANR